MSTTATQSITQLAPSAPPGGGTSTNWSGYVVPSTEAVTEVGGTWTVPQLNCASTPNAGVGIWVGIGGAVNDETLLQTGTTSDCVNGAQVDFAWFEEVPSNPNHSFVFLGFPVAAGQTFHATVYQSPTGVWETRVDNLSTGLSGVMVTGEGWGVMNDQGNGTFPLQGSTAALTYPGGTTAEWIAEAYLQIASASLVTLADFGSVTFSNLTTSLQSWDLTDNESVTLTDPNGNPLSIPSAPTGGPITVTYVG